MVAADHLWQRFRAPEGGVVESAERHEHFQVLKEVSALLNSVSIFIYSFSLYASNL